MDLGIFTCACTPLKRAGQFPGEKADWKWAEERVTGKGVAGGGWA
jgi:hypothetical protein